MGRTPSRMKRITIVVSVVCLIGALMAPWSRAATTPSVTLLPPSGQTTVVGDEVFTVEGTAATGSELNQATLRPVDAQGQGFSHPTVGRTYDVDVTSFLTIDPEGRISGEVEYTKAEPSDTYGYLLELRVEDSTGISEPGSSPILVRDAVAPRVLRYALVAPSKILVTFTEPVTYGGNSNSPGNPLDWEVENDRVTQVDFVGNNLAQRLITVNRTYAEDATSKARYFTVTIPLDQNYRDGSALTISNENALRTVIDRQVPRVPQLAVNSSSHETVVGNQRSVAVVLTNVSAGHTAELFADANKDGRGSPSESVGRKLSEGTSLNFTYTAASEGSHPLLAMAYDNAVDEDGTSSPNKSSETRKTYILDVTSPAALGLDVVDANYLRVRFSEPVFGPDSINDWRIGAGQYPITAIYNTDDGRTRLLQVKGVPQGTTVTYKPIGSSRYADHARNPLPDVSLTSTTAQPGVGSTASPSATPSATASPRPSTTATPSASPSTTPSPAASPTPTTSPTPTPTPPPGDIEVEARNEQDAGASGECQNVIVHATRNGQPVSGTNIDVLLLDDTLHFCGNNSGDHSESYTDTDGTTVFAVYSERAGDLQLLTWVDEVDDDELGDGEFGRRATVTFRFTGERTISLSAPSMGFKGRKARLSGQITAAVSECSAEQFVRIVRRRAGRSKLIATVITGDDGTFTRKVRINKTASYRAVVGAVGGCDAARSAPARVRAV
jgi:hypothetical protein